MYEVEVLNYPVFVRLGYFPQERLVGQEILISLHVKLEIEADPSRGDDLRHTVDYGALVKTVDQVLLGLEVKLVETACDIVARALLKNFRLIKEISVTIEKTLLPRGIAKGATFKVRRRLVR